MSQSGVILFLKPYHSFYTECKNMNQGRQSVSYKFSLDKLTAGRSYFNSFSYRIRTKIILYTNYVIKIKDNKVLENTSF